MTKTVFKRIEIENFRQHKSITQDFDPDLNVIRGANGTGKSNFLSAITWCLYGTDINNRTRFNVTPLDKDQKPLDLDTSVTLTFSFNDEEHSFKRELIDDKTTVYQDGIKLKTLKEYDAIIEGIFGKSDEFKMLTNPLYFGDQMHWKDQREYIVDFVDLPDGLADDLVEAIKDSGLYPDDKDQSYYVDNADTLIKDKLKGIEAVRESIREDLDVARSKLQDLEAKQEELPDEDVDVESIKAQAKAFDQELEDITLRNNDRRLKVMDLKDKIQDLQRAHFRQESKRTELINKKNNLDSSLEYLKRQSKELADKYTELKRVTFENAKCDLCGREMTKKQKIEAEHKKQDQLDFLQMQGMDNIERYKNYDLELKDIEKQLKDIGRTVAVEDTAEYKDLQAQIDKLTSEIEDIPSPDPETFSIYKSLQSVESIKNDVKHAKEDVKRLEDKERKQNSEFEKVKVLESKLKDYELKRAQALAKAVNQCFDKIQINVLDFKKNGNIAETFEITRDGVPYDDLNTAKKLEACIELTDFVRDRKQKDIPIIIDNGESYTDVDLSAIKPQILIAIATKNAKLSVSNSI